MNIIYISAFTLTLSILPFGQFMHCVCYALSLPFYCMNRGKGSELEMIEPKAAVRLLVVHE